MVFGREDPLPQGKAMSFTDDDLKQLNKSLGHPSRVFLGKSSEYWKALLARLEAAEQVIADILHPDHGFFNEKSWRTEHLVAWRKSKGE